jgi:2-haloalkanoic acid dehalogenase type II
MKRPSIISFDCYGTLVDWESGITEAFVQAAASYGITIDPGTVIVHYAEAEAAVEAGGYRSYREVLTECALQVAQRLGWQLPRNEASFLVESLPSWRAFPDTNAALRQLREEGMHLAILSNTDRDLLAASRRHLDVDFDFVVTAEDVRSYKPEAGHFLAARERIGSQPWIHAGASIFHDIVPTRRMAIQNAWVNRKNEEWPASSENQADLICTDLLALADAVLSL